MIHKEKEAWKDLFVAWAKTTHDYDSLPLFRLGEFSSEIYVGPMRLCIHTLKDMGHFDVTARNHPYSYMSMSCRYHSRQTTSQIPDINDPSFDPQTFFDDLYERLKPH